MAQNLLYVQAGIYLTYVLARIRLMNEGATMNLDERLEALTHSVELLAAMHKDSDKRMERLEGLATEIAEGTARLLHVVEVHEQRISDLEENQAQ
jgi:hypothetical protein